MDTHDRILALEARVTLLEAAHQEMLKGLREVDTAAAGARVLAQMGLTVAQESLRAP